MDWNIIPEQEIIDKVMAGMRERNFNPVLVNDRKSALEKLKQMIPSGADVMTGSSTTLEEMGFIGLLSSKKHPWQNWKDRIFAENDTEKRYELRRMSTTASYFLGSVQAITEAGEALGTDATGSRQGGYVYSAKHVIWVVGLNKVVPNLDMASRRLYEHCVPLEDARVKKTGGSGTTVGKIAIYEKEDRPQRIFTVLVREKLGF